MPRDRLLIMIAMVAEMIETAIALAAGLRHKAGLVGTNRLDQRCRHCPISPVGQLSNWEGRARAAGRAGGLDGRCDEWMRA